MASKNSLFSKGWCDTVFEGKNKAFGAYALRRNSDKRHFKALVIIVVTISLAIILPVILNNTLQNVQKETIEVVNLSQIKLEMEDIPDMPIEPLKAEDLPNSGGSKISVPTSSEKSGSLVISKEGEKVDLGAKTKEVTGDDTSWENNSKSFSEKKEEQTDENEVLTAPEEMPKFDGRDAVSSFREYVIKHLRYPESVENQHVEGTVYAQFVVERSGALSNIRILRGVHTDIDNEVVRVIKGSPIWTPGKQRGKLVRVAYTFPIVFQID